MRRLLEIALICGVGAGLASCKTTEDEPVEKQLTVGSATSSPVKRLPAKDPEVIKAPDWRVGAEWLYSDGYNIRVKSVIGEITVFERLDAPGRWTSRRGFLWEGEKTQKTLRRVIYRTVPTNAGMSLTPRSSLVFRREYLANGALREHNTSWTVEGRERITVPAGQFETWVIVMRTRSLKSNWAGFERWWYSPDVQNYVRLEYKYGDGQESSRVLMSYGLGTR
jgi:hypothetical protein